MSKYIIELNEDCKIVQQMCVTEHGNAYTNGCYSCDLEELNSDYINEHFGELQDEAYQRGYDEGYKKCLSVYDFDQPCISCEGYKRGLNDAWKAARKIVVNTDNGGIASETLLEIFGMRGYSYIMQENTAQEAIDKIKAYEEQADRIEVGDEVKHHFQGYGVVTRIKEVNGKTHYNAVWSNGNTGYYESDDLTKTGKHYDIASILEAMRTHD